MRSITKNSASAAIGRQISPPLLWVLLLALVARVLAVVFLPDQGLPDAGSYRTAAEQFRHFQLMTNPNIMPLYPLLIALVGDGWAQKATDAALSLASVWVVHAIALRIYRDQAIAFFAALFCALWPHFLFFAAAGLTETLFIALVLAAFLCLYDRGFAFASALLVLAILTRPAIDLLAPCLVALFSLVVHREPFQMAAKRLLVYAVVYVALMTPWWTYNYARYGEFVRLDLGGGMFLYTGNNPLNASGGGDGYADSDITRFFVIADPVQRDRAYHDAAVAYIEANPWHFLAMMPVKFSRVWRPWPYTGEYHSTPVLLVSVLSAVPAFAFALAGLVLTLRPHFLRLLPPLAYVGYLTLVHMITLGSVRYRVPLEPFILVLASAGLVLLMRKLGVGRRLLLVLPSAP